MAVKIKIINAGANISNTLQIWTNETGPFTPFTVVSKSVLLAGYTFEPPVGTTAYQVRDNFCGAITELSCGSTTTTTLNICQTSGGVAEYAV